jgi:hypothetical protein
MFVVSPAYRVPQAQAARQAGPGHTAGSSPRRWDVASVGYPLARRWAPDQCDSAVWSMSAREAAGSSEAAASI